MSAHGLGHMTNEVHIHEIMSMMIESGKIYSRASLKSAIQEQFGADTSFCTCSMQGLDTEQAIAFMEMRGKFVASEDGLSMPPENRCNH